jgi:hypothetical protein
MVAFRLKGDCKKSGASTSSMLVLSFPLSGQEMYAVVSCTGRKGTAKDNKKPTSPSTVAERIVVRYCLRSCMRSAELSNGSIDLVTAACAFGESDTGNHAISIAGKRPFSYHNVLIFILSAWVLA